MSMSVIISLLFRFGSADFIMEPEIFAQLKKYFQAGGNPEQVGSFLFFFFLGLRTMQGEEKKSVFLASFQVIELLSKNYLAMAQMANLMAEWLILAGAEINDVQQQVNVKSGR